MRPLDDQRNFRRLPPATDSEFMRALGQMVDAEEIELLVPTVTEELSSVAEQRDVIRRKGCAVFVSPPNAMRVANDKWITASTLLAAGIPVPRSYCGDVKEELVETIRFPALSKPRVGRGGRGILIHKTAEDLPDTLPADRVFQEFLPGQEYDVNLFADPGGIPVVSVVLKKAQLRNGMVGNAVAVERVEERDIAQLAERATRALSLEGPIDIDIRRGQDGRPAILEINARFGANVRSAEEVLVTMLTSWRSHCSRDRGEPVYLCSCH